MLLETVGTRRGFRSLVCLFSSLVQRAVFNTHGGIAALVDLFNHSAQDGFMGVGHLMGANLMAGHSGILIACDESTWREWLKLVRDEFRDLIVSDLSGERDAKDVLGGMTRAILRTDGVCIELMGVKRDHLNSRPQIAFAHCILLQWPIQGDKLQLRSAVLSVSRILLDRGGIAYVRCKSQGLRSLSILEIADLFSTDVRTR